MNLFALIRSPNTINAAALKKPAEKRSEKTFVFHEKSKAMIEKKPQSLEIWTQCLFWLSLVAAGLFHNYIACLFLSAFSALTLTRLCKTKEISLSLNWTFVAIFALAIGYCVSGLWAVDSGLAFIGFLKFLPAVMFLLLLDKSTKDQIIKAFPYGMAIIAAASMLLSPVASRYLLVANRLAGFIQYPNTFALLLLVSQLLLTARKEFSIKNTCVLLILLMALLYTGSRTVFVLAVISNAVLMISMLKHKKHWISITIPIVVTIGIVAVVVMSRSEILGRFLRFSPTESTFVGRILYAYDAIPLILKHPFGMGSMGYYYIQQTVQTGVYSTMYVHNDLLQIMLDVGWLPGILWIVALISSILKKSGNRVHKIIIFVLFAHSCFDFDLQFTAVYFVFLLFMDTDSEQRYVLRPTWIMKSIISVLVIAGAYMAVATGLPQIGFAEAGQAMYPWNTPNNAQILIQIDDLEQANKEADRILKQNSHVNVAHSVKAHYAYSQGDLGEVIERKTLILKRFPFQYEEYEEYCEMLIVAITSYEQAGDVTSAEICRAALKDTVTEFSTLQNRLSFLGRRIKDQPITEFPAELMQRINKVLNN